MGALHGAEAPLFHLTACGIVRCKACGMADKITQAVSPPTLAKNARMGHPQWKWCTQTFVEGRPPALNLYLWGDVVSGRWTRSRNPMASGSGLGVGMLRLRSEGRFALLTAPLSMTEGELDGSGGMNLGRWRAEGGCLHMSWVMRSVSSSLRPVLGYGATEAACPFKPGELYRSAEGLRYPRSRTLQCLLASARDRVCFMGCRTGVSDPHGQSCVLAGALDST
jgi:hypothetical protein